MAAIRETGGELKSCPLCAASRHVRGEDREVLRLVMHLACHRKTPSISICRWRQGEELLNPPLQPDLTPRQILGDGAPNPTAFWRVVLPMEPSPRAKTWKVAALSNPVVAVRFPRARAWCG